MNVSQQLLSLASIPSYRGFQASLKAPQAAQEKVLNGLIKGGVLQSRECLESAPLHEYSDYKSDIERARSLRLGPFGKCPRFEPTSGSTESMKWIPYTSLFKSQLDRAAGPWLRDLYLNYPKIKNGPHYWSLSWLPDELRSEIDNKDTNALPWYKSMLLNNLMVTDSSFETLPTSKIFMMTSLLKILEKEASLISVWSPTFLLRLLDLVIEEKSWLLEGLQKGSRLAGVLKEVTTIEADSLRELFPKLALISAWDSCSSSYWASKVKDLFPDVPFQAKGLWATEGVVTFPFQGSHPLAVCSHYYEFWNESSQELLKLSDLSLGMTVQPVITTGGGFVRYHLRDNIEVTNFLEKTPCFRFHGRSRHVDMAGEKISFGDASVVMEKLTQRYCLLTPLCLVAHDGENIREYQALVEGVEDCLSSDQINKFEKDLESKLAENYHYKLARELGQLGPAKILLKRDALSYYYEICGQKISGEGNIKPEPLIHFKEHQ